MFGKKNKTHLPKWADDFGLTEAGYSHFRDELLSYTKGALDANTANSSGIASYKGADISLANLGVSCALLPVASWGAEIERWLSFVVKGGADRPTPKYPEQIQLIALQLYAKRYFDAIPGGVESMLAKEEIPGIYTTLVVNWPDSIAAYSRDSMPDWWEHFDETVAKLKQALSASNPQPLASIDVSIGDKNYDLYVLQGDSEITSVDALVLEKLYPQTVGKEGVLVGIPNCKTLFMLRLDEAPIKELLSHFSFVVSEEWSNSTSRTLSKNIYLLKDGKFTVA